MNHYLLSVIIDNDDNDDDDDGEWSLMLETDAENIGQAFDILKQQAIERMK